MRFLMAASAALIGVGTWAAAAAQNYPQRPVRILVGYAPGGGVDIAARIVAQGLTEVWGNQTALVENRPGAAGGIATELTAAATPDGYTLLLCTIASHGITPARAKKLPYDPIKDFSFPSMVGITPNVIVTHPAMAMRSLRDVIQEENGAAPRVRREQRSAPPLGVEPLPLSLKPRRYASPRDIRTSTRGRA